MTKSDLEAKLVNIQERFNAAQNQSNEFQTEMRRLEGEFRLTQELIKEIGNAAENKPTESTDSNKRPGK